MLQGRHRWRCMHTVPWVSSWDGRCHANDQWADGNDKYQVQFNFIIITSFPERFNLPFSATGFNSMLWRLASKDKKKKKNCCTYLHGKTEQNNLQQQQSDVTYTQT